MEVNELVKEIVGFRVRHNMSMKEFAELCGVTLQTIWNIENGKHKPLRTVEYKIMQVIDNEVE